MGGRRKPLARGALAIAGALIASVAVASSAGFAQKSQPNHCFTPAGDDLNEEFATSDAFVAPFCTEMRTGDRWRAVLRVAAAGGGYVFPAGYEPAVLPLDEDFLAKLVSARFVVDQGTRQERSYSFAADELTIQHGSLPGDARFVRWLTPSLPPLPPGVHTVSEYVTLSGTFWDGLDVEPGANSVAEGESVAGAVEFTVRRPSKG